MAIDRKLLIENAIIDIDRRANDRQLEAGELYLKAMQGDRRATMTLQEGVSTSDIPSLLAPAINVQFLANYAAQPVVWDQIVEDVIDAPDLGTVEFGGFDFDASDLIGIHDGDTFVGAGMPGVAEYGEYPAVNFTTETLNATLRKFGLRFRFSWEAFVKTGNLDMLGKSIKFFSRKAAEAEDIALAKVMVSPAGVLNTAFTDVTGTPALTLASLETAIGQSSSATVGGNPINPRGYTLVVPTTLEMTAKNILSITSILRTDGSDQYTVTPNTGNVKAVPFWALQSVGNYTTANAVDDNWILVPTGTARPALAEVFLEGYRTPLISVKDSGHFTLGGAGVPAREGSFESDDISTRGRHAVGASIIENAGIMKSDGA